MFLPLISIIASLAAGQQSQSMGAAEALRTPPVPTEAPATAVRPADAGAAPTPAEPPRMICRSIPVTGSRFPVRQCRSSVQTEAERTEAREMLRRMQGARTPQPG